MSSTITAHSTGANAQATQLQNIAETLRALLLEHGGSTDTTQLMFETVRRMQNVPMSDVRYAITFGKAKGLFTTNGSTNTIQVE